MDERPVSRLPMSEVALTADQEGLILPVHEHKKQFGVLKGTIIVVVITAMSACSALPQAEGEGSTGLSMEEAQAQYDQRTSELSLPDAAEWPELPTTGPNGEQLEYAQWAPTLNAESHWRCSWQEEWLDVQGRDDGQADDALAELTTFTDMRTYTSLYDDASREQFDDQMDRAALGDAGPMRQDSDVNCSDS